MFNQTRTALSKQFLSGVFAIAAFYIPLTGGGAADWNETQSLDIRADSFNQVLYFDYDTSGVSLSGVGYGDRQVNYTVRDGSFVGAFLYDYSEFQFTTGFYAITLSF